MGSEPNAASVAIVEGTRVLLIQRAREPYAGHWSLPGGRLEPGETPEQCARREIREELGVSFGAVHITNTLSSSDIVGNHWRLTVFTALTYEGVITTSDEIADYRWATLHEAAALETTPDLDFVLRRIFESLGRD